jgi:threonine/homoserine/homoserine lactone efflux protein
MKFDKDYIWVGIAILGVLSVFISVISMVSYWVKHPDLTYMQVLQSDNLFWIPVLIGVVFTFFGAAMLDRKGE